MPRPFNGLLAKSAKVKCAILNRREERMLALETQSWPPADPYNQIGAPAALVRSFDAFEESHGSFAVPAASPASAAAEQK
jgi:hypothetical protein